MILPCLCSSEGPIPAHVEVYVHIVSDVTEYEHVIRGICVLSLYEYCDSRGLFVSSEPSACSIPMVWCDMTYDEMR